MNSRWQANKIGLINFWYYNDGQEYDFVKGRMLLRGSNGSGKSVTMQSVVPLLLDGNMSPERLDPFGTKDRKMSGYLLEEDDERDERTGYLYMEFKRQDSDTYITIGMGICAKKGKKLDKWYFGLSDGRRVGKDFFLYKETNEKVTLSKKELMNRVGDGGMVCERQQEYMEYVNRQIFGFDTIEDYKEMIDLLIQLRTPKLSKDFKPSVINDILSNSLQALSEDDLRPMSEAIENMDTMSMNLKNRRASKVAAEKINQVFSQYNQWMLYEKTERLVNEEKEFHRLQQEKIQCEKQIEEYDQDVKELQVQIEQMDATKLAMEAEKDSLNSSNAVGLKNEELELSQKQGKLTERLHEKELQLDTKKDVQIDNDVKIKQEQDKRDAKEMSIHGLMEEMQENADLFAFEEHKIFAKELLEYLLEEQNESMHEQQLKNSRRMIQEGKGILEELDRKQKEIDVKLSERDRKKRDVDLSVKKVDELEDVFAQIRNEWKESLYIWNAASQEMQLDATVLQQMCTFAQDYEVKSDYMQMMHAVNDVYAQNRGKLETQKGKYQLEMKDTQEQLAQKKQELDSWMNSREPEPERSEAVVLNRKRLQEKGIPYVEFYKVIEFGKQLDMAACNHLEEALDQMGILDALIVEEQYRSQVLQMDAGSCDRYLFVEKQHVEHSLLDYLELNDYVNDIFWNQRITGILNNISYYEAGNTAILEDGVYTIGAITGTITGTYEAGFLGVQARERSRRQKIEACETEINVLTDALNELARCVDELDQRMRVLKQNLDDFPKETDLREACRLLEEQEAVRNRLQTELFSIEEEIRKRLAAVSDLKKAAVELSGKLYLSCEYETFVQADVAAQEYEKLYYKLKSEHMAYIQHAVRMIELQERTEELDMDMDQIRYDQSQDRAELFQVEAKLTSVREQLKLTDYEQIQNRLNECLSWLNHYPSNMKNYVETQARKSALIEQLNAKSAGFIEKLEKTEKMYEYFLQCFHQEKNLAYVQLPENLEQNNEKLYEYLQVSCSNLQKDTLVSNLNRIFFENRGFLNEYQVTFRQLFGGEQEDSENLEGRQENYPSPERLDICARYQGTSVSFGEMLGFLTEEIADLENLIKDGDRALFEDILANTVGRRIRGRINSSITWVEKMNSLMGAMNTSSGLKLSLRWRSKTAEQEDQLDTRELVELLKKDYRLMRPDEASKLSEHFRSKVEAARRHAQDSVGMITLHQVMRDTLDYRKWFEFQLFFQKSGEKVKELTNSMFGTFSGGEKAMSMYVPLFSAVVAKYQGCRKDAPRLISLDEAFAGVDNKNIRDMFRLMTEFQFDFIINSQVLWGDCDTLDALAVYQLIRPDNVKYVTVLPYIWNGKIKELIQDETEMEQRAAQF